MATHTDSVFTDLQAQLNGPGGPAARQQAIERARALEARLRARLAIGVPRDAFPVWESAAAAAAAAAAILSDYDCPKAAGTAAPSSLFPPPAR